MEEITRVRESTGTAPRSPYQPTAGQQAAARRPSTPAPKYTRDNPAPAPSRTSRQREYKRDPKGTSTGGQFTRNPAGAKAAPKKVTTRPKRSGGGSGGSGRTASGKRRTPPPLEFGARNDPDRVRFLQRLLKSLKIANLPVDGVYGEATERAVMALQRKLGLTETGRVSNALLRRIRDAEILSPCAKGAKRSKEMDDMDELIRGVMVVDPDEDVEDEEPDEEVEDDEEEHEPAARSLLHQPSLGEILRYDRVWPLEGIEIERGGDGRTVTAYAAVFDVPTEIKDQHGHYIEEIDRAAFNRDITRSKPQGGRDYWLTNCFYNHGADLSGQPNALMSVPLGSPLEIRPDGKGVLTVTRYNKSDLADSVLEAIRNGDIRSQSFRGRIYKSTPERVPRSRGGDLPTIRRTELGLAEYGPTPSAFYKEAAIVAVRAEQVAHTLAQLPASERAELIRMLSQGAPFGDSPEAQAVASDVELDAQDSPIGRSAMGQAGIARKITRALILMEVAQ